MSKRKEIIGTLPKSAKRPQPKGGSRKGVPNKKTQIALKSIELVMSTLDKTIINDIEDLPPVERVKMWQSLQEYLRPKLARTEISGDGGGPVKHVFVMSTIECSDNGK